MGANNSNIIKNEIAVNFEGFSKQFKENIVRKISHSMIKVRNIVFVRVSCKLDKTITESIQFTFKPCACHISKYKTKGGNICNQYALIEPILNCKKPTNLNHIDGFILKAIKHKYISKNNSFKLLTNYIINLQKTS